MGEIRTRGEFHRLRISRVEPLCPGAAAVSFEVPAELTKDFAFHPGQWLTVRRFVNGREERRSYSVCSAFGDAPRVGIREVPNGVLSPWLVHEVRCGDEVEVQPPSGFFTPDLEHPGRHVLIAAGSGITPVLSIAASVLGDEASRVTLIYGNRRSDSVMFVDEIADLKDRYPDRFDVVHVLSREAQEVELFTGRLDAAKLLTLLPAVCGVGDVDQWWLCGPYGMVNDAISVLKAFHVPDDRIHRELFYVEDVPPEPVHHDDVATEGAKVTVVLEGRSATTTVGWDKPILDGMQKVRPDLPFACKGGVCGTCRAKLLDGTVHMRRNFALEQSELDDGFILTCQAVPTSDEVHVDYDA